MKSNSRVTNKQQNTHHAKHLLYAVYISIYAHFIIFLNAA